MAVQQACAAWAPPLRRLAAFTRTRTCIHSHRARERASAAVCWARAPSQCRAVRPQHAKARASRAGSPVVRQALQEAKGDAPWMLDRTGPRNGGSDRLRCRCGPGLMGAALLATPQDGWCPNVPTVPGAHHRTRLGPVKLAWSHASVCINCGSLARCPEHGDLISRVLCAAYRLKAAAQLAQRGVAEALERALGSLRLAWFRYSDAGPRSKERLRPTQHPGTRSRKP